MLRWFVGAVFCLSFALWVPAAPAGAAKPGTRNPTEAKKKSAAPEVHKVKRGETLWGIARLHGVSVGGIMDLNHLDGSTLREGQDLKIPPAAKDPVATPARATTHTIAKGETFRSIARQYVLSRDELANANPHVDPDHPKAGAKLVIPAAAFPVQKRDTVDGTSAPVPKAFHTVAENDTYSSIARKYGVTIEGVATANPEVTPERIQPGMKINLPPRQNAGPYDGGNARSATPKKSSATEPARHTVTRNVPDDAAAAAPEGKPRPMTRRYIVSADETPQTISEAFEISEKKLYEINGLKPGSPMKTGLEIQVPNSPGEGP